MRFLRLTALALVLLPLTTAAQTVQTNPVGEWRAVFVGPLDDRPKMVDAVTFSIRTTSDGLTGTAQAGQWPGSLEISDVKVAGDRLTFTAIGKEGYRTSSGGKFEEHCCPKLVFTGTIDGDQMKLTLDWQSTEHPSNPVRRPTAADGRFP